MVYIRVTGRAIINVHSANAEGAVGNYMGLSKMFIVRRTSNGYEVSEDAVISGNMIKHWHAIRVIELLKEKGVASLCDSCKRFIMYRSTLPYNEEFEFIKACAIEDLHGFLQPNTQVRRESLVKFAFMIPVEEMRAEYAAITHNRVVTTPEGRIPAEEQAMMVFKREHASGVYGFLCSMDLKYVGKPLADPENPEKTLPLKERKLRAKCAVLALADVLSGRFGAASSRAMPAIRTIELICAVSRQPIPNLVHGFYMDYLEESARMLGSLSSSLAGEIKVFVYGDRVVKELSKVKALENVLEIEKSPISALAEASRVVEDWLT
ncbi:MAG: type I-A CRISPR-associated protein Cas7/Csa2 [Thermoprotei archaeon]|nr:MAG: type I-A CRISPR-associated protein Cas7/Csa2 [Thermoprotei archaeon]RLE95433.1 MAG: type I-A CRISPR-associated protein Cas7/Csa2 [Thermoprotei archaeon]